MIDKIHSCSTLPDRHLLGLEFTPVVLSNLVDVLLELTCLLEFLEVTLALDVRVGGKHDVLVRPVDVLLPHCEPCAFLIVLDFLPLVAFWRLRNHRFFADVDRDLFR